MATIALFCKTFVKGGAEKQALTLARLLSDQGLDVIVISWSSGKTDLQNSAYIASNGLKYYELAGNPLKKCIALERIIKKVNVALIFAYLTLANFVSGVIRLFNKSVITFGGIRTEKLPYYKFIFERLVHNRLNNATIFNNFSAKSKFIPRGFRSQKVIVIHNAIGLTEERPAQESRDMVNIITVARFVKSKDFPVSLSSFKSLVSENQATPLKYTMIGYGPEEPLLHMRAGSDMYLRRAGWKYAKTQARLFKFMKQQGFIENGQYIKSCVIRSGSALAPNWLRKFMFEKVLRK